MDFQQIENEMADVTIGVIQEISRENARRSQGALADLANGVFSNYQYAALLQEKGALSRREFMLKHHYFCIGYVPNKYFEFQPSLDSAFPKAPFHFTLRAGLSASAGLDALRQGLSLLDCGRVVRLAQLEALRQQLGDEKFDLIFSAEGPVPLRFGDPSTFFWMTSERHNPSSPFKRGAVYYFDGHPAYNFKHPRGFSPGHNVVCSGQRPEPKFVGFCLNPDGVTQAELEQDLLREFRKESQRFSCLYGNVAKVLKERHRRLVDEEMLGLSDEQVFNLPEGNQGCKGFREQVQYIDPKIVLLLKRASEDRIRELVARVL